MHTAGRVDADVQFRGRVRDKIIMRIIPAHRAPALLRNRPRKSRNSRHSRNDETSRLEYLAPHFAPETRRNASSVRILGRSGRGIFRFTAARQSTSGFAN